MATIKQKIVPHLWFDKEAREAAGFYTSVFDGSRITSTTTLHDTPSGTVDVVTFELSGQEFIAISAGPMFEFNESISFVVKCETQQEIDFYWEQLTSGGGDPQQWKGPFCPSHDLLSVYKGQHLSISLIINELKWYRQKMHIET